MSEYEDDFGPAIHFRFGSGLTPTVRILLIINAALYILTLLLFIFSKPALLYFYQWLTLVPEEAVFRLKLWQFITHGFIHSLDPGHIFFNMLGLFFFGPHIERHLESRSHFLVFYLSCILFGALCQATVGVFLSPQAEILGASAAVIGLIVAAAVLQPDSRVIFFIFPLKLKHLAMFLVGMDIIYSLLDAGGPPGTGGVARLAHLGGALFGFVYIKFMPKIKTYFTGARDRADTRAFKRMLSDEEELDRLLTKIHTWGMGSLTRRERKFLMDRDKDKE